MDKTNTMGIKSMSVKERIALAHDTSDEEVLCTLAKDEDEVSAKTGKIRTKNHFLSIGKEVILLCCFLTYKYNETKKFF